jgi:hypothetical protein
VIINPKDDLLIIFVFQFGSQFAGRNFVECSPTLLGTCIDGAGRCGAHL